MDKFRNYDVAFSGLKNGKHEFVFGITQEFFDLFEAEQEFTNAKIEAKVFLEKHTTFLDFLVKTEGTVDLTCDISNEEFTYPIENEIKILVKFGEEYDDSNEEIITIPMTDSHFNAAQLIFEAVVLSIPMKKLAPHIEDHSTYAELLDKFSPKIREEKESTEDQDIDPRWEALKKLKNK